MALIRSRDALPPSQNTLAQDHDEAPNADVFDLNHFEEELKRLAEVNQQLMNNLHAESEDGVEAMLPTLPPLEDSEETALLRKENNELRARIQQLEQDNPSMAGPGEDAWLERQREYEMLLEEKSEVIRNLHQKVQQLQDSAISSDGEAISSGTGQATEILRLKREMEVQRSQLNQDEEDVMAQLRQMEMTMAKERAEMARQRQEITRLQADLTREIEIASRDPALHDRLQHLRRNQDKLKASVAATAAIASTPASTPTPYVKSAVPDGRKKSSGLFRRIFG